MSWFVQEAEHRKKSDVHEFSFVVFIMRWFLWYGFDSSGSVQSFPQNMHHVSKMW